MAYHPTLGKWIQRDPAGYVDGGNLYQYVNSNCVNLVDPEGLADRLHGGARPTTQPLPLVSCPNLAPPPDFTLMTPREWEQLAAKDYTQVVPEYVKQWPEPGALADGSLINTRSWYTWARNADNSNVAAVRIRVGMMSGKDLNLGPVATFYSNNKVVNAGTNPFFPMQGASTWERTINNVYTLFNYRAWDVLFLLHQASDPCQSWVYMKTYVWYWKAPGSLALMEGTETGFGGVIGSVATPPPGWTTLGQNANISPGSMLGKLPPPRIMPPPVR